MSEWHISWREIDEWTDEQFNVHLSRLVDRVRNEAAKYEHVSAGLGGHKQLISEKEAIALGF